MQSSGVTDAVNAAKGADAAVVVVGSMPFINGREDHDRTFMNLPPAQEAVVKAVTAANPHTIVVLEDSYPTTINWEQANDPAILWTTHAGQETGHALADVLFGDYNPSGHLTQTWPQSQSQVADIMDYDIIKSGQTYMYDTQRPLYPFGYGLSYATFSYGPLRLSAPAMGGDGSITASLEVTNTGPRGQGRGPALRAPGPLPGAATDQQAHRLPERRPAARTDADRSFRGQGDGSRLLGRDAIEVGGRAVPVRAHGWRVVGGHRWRAPPSS